MGWINKDQLGAVKQAEDLDLQTNGQIYTRPVSKQQHIVQWLDNN